MANKRQGAERVPETKKKEVEELASAIDKHNTICIVNMEGLPARQLQVIRNKIRSEATVRMSKKAIIQRALKECKKQGAQALLEHLKGMPAFLFSKADAFELYQLLKKNQSPAAAKVGQISPEDIEVKAGMTSLTPGPAISTLSAVGLAAGVDAGKITIKKGKVIVKEGEEFTQPVVDVLNLLKIEPMKIGINLIVALQEGEIFTGKILDIDTDKFAEDIASALSQLLHRFLHDRFQRARVPGQQFFDFRKTHSNLLAGHGVSPFQGFAQNHRRHQYSPFRRTFARGRPERSSTVP